MQFVGAKVMAVSVVPCWGRAVVLLVSSSPCFCVLRAIFVALLGLMWVRWASIFTDQQSWDPTGRVCCAVYLAAEPVYWHP